MLAVALFLQHPCTGDLQNNYFFIGKGVEEESIFVPNNVWVLPN